jgi:hypothetical protein
MRRRVVATRLAAIQNMQIEPLKLRKKQSFSKENILT